MQLAVAPIVPENVPAVHETQDVARVDRVYAPAAQIVHSEAPRLEYVPAAQAVHAVAALGENVPASHAVHLIDRSPEYVPAVQGVQLEAEIAPAVLEDLPAAQERQTVTPVATAYEPAPQLKHLFSVTPSPSSLENFPASQA